MNYEDKCLKYVLPWLSINQTMKLCSVEEMQAQT